MTGFLTEPHLHTAETSPCGKVPGGEMIALYAAAGYTTVFVTDHYKGRFFDPRAELPWEEAVGQYLAGWRAARAAGDRLGVNVLLSAELRFTGAPEDFLLYGIDEGFLLAHPRLDQMEPERFRALAVAEGVTVIQAHPFRNTCTAKPALIDGVEIVNTNPRHLVHARNEAALALAEENPALLRASGSDAHRIEDVGRGGVRTAAPIRTADDYIGALRRGECELLADLTPVEAPDAEKGTE